MYAGIDDMTTRFGEQELLELTDANLTGTVDAAVVQTAIGDATELINGYVAGRYRVPLVPVPDMVRRWCCDIARFYLHKVAVPDAVKAGHDAALLLDEREQKMPGVDLLLPVLAGEVLRLLHGESGFFGESVKIDVHGLIIAQSVPPETSR